MALNVAMRKASSVPTRSTANRRSGGSCTVGMAPRSRTQLRPQALYLSPRNIPVCRPARFYRAPGLSVATGLGLLNTMLGSDWLREATSNVHPVEITTHEAFYELQTDCPGMSQEDITVDVSPDRVLTIAGARKAKTRQTKTDPASAPTSTPTSATAADTAPTDDQPPERLPAEVASAPDSEAFSAASAASTTATEPPTARVSYRFHRSFVLPEDADVDSVNASLEHGVLTLNIPRRVQPKPQPRRITIN